MFRVEFPSHFYSYPLTQVEVARIVEEQAQNQREISKKMTEYLGRLQTKIDILEERNKQNSVILATHLEIQGKKRRERKNRSASDVLQPLKKPIKHTQDEMTVSIAYFGSPKRGNQNRNDFFKESYSVDTRREVTLIEDMLSIISNRVSKPNKQMGKFFTELERDNPERNQQLRLPFIKQTNFNRRKRARLIG